MRILIVSQYYKPEVIHIPHTLAEELSARNHDVTVITGYPNYPRGKIFSGYKQRIFGSQIDKGVRVIRVPLWISHSENAVGRLANYITFALSALLHMLFLRKFDVIYVYATQMTPAIGPSVLRKVRRTPYVMHVQDLWPESVTSSSMVKPGRVARSMASILRPWLKGLYRESRATIAIAPTMAKMLVDRGVPEGRIHTVLNWTDEEWLNTEGRERGVQPGTRRDGEAVRIVYAGNLGDHQDLETVLEAAKIASMDVNLRLDLYGSGVAEARLKEIAKRIDVQNVTFHGRVSSQEMVSVYESCDFQLVTLRDREIFRGTVPSKLQGSLARGCPILTNVQGDVAQLCATGGFGLTCLPSSKFDMARMFIQAASLSGLERSTMAENGRDFYRHQMSHEHGVSKVEKILCDVVKQKEEKLK